MPVLNAQAIADSYPTGAKGAILSDVFNSRGGWFSVSTAAAFMQMQYGPRGASYWTEEVEVGNGAFAYLDPKCTGVRFRNAVAGQAGVVTAQIAQGEEPPLSIVALGVVSTATVGPTHTVLTAPLLPTTGTPYTPPAGAKRLLVECIGGGGAGGGAAATAASTVAVGGGGAGAGYGAVLIDLVALGPFAFTYQIGNGGAKQSGAGGGAGGDTQFQNGVNILAIGRGGPGGALGGAGAPPFRSGGSSAGGLGVGDYAIDGSPGEAGLSLSATIFVSGNGGAAARGGGGAPGQASTSGGLDGGAYGGGGGGAASGINQAASAGGNGAPGIIVVTEFY